MDANLSPLAMGSADPLGLVYQSYAMRASQPLLAQVFTPKLTAAQLSTAVNSLTSGAADGGALVDLDGDGNLWRPSSRVLYSDPNQAPDPGVARATFYLPKAAMDPWGNVATVTYDAAHLLFVTATSDALGNTTQAQINYRVCGPWLMTDANLNRTGVRLDPLGRVVATAVMGKLLSGSGSSEVDEGDHLDATTPESSSADDPTRTRLVYDLTDAAAASPVQEPLSRCPSPGPEHAVDPELPLHRRSRARGAHQGRGRARTRGRALWQQRHDHPLGGNRQGRLRQQGQPGEGL